MAVLFSGKVAGLTAAFAAGTATGIVATKDIELHSDGLLRFTNANGRVRSVKASGELAELLREIFTGAGGTSHKHQE